MRWSETIDAFVAGLQDVGKLRTPRSERSYRDPLYKHAEDCGWGRDPRESTREDVKLTLRRWPHQNTKRTRRAVLVTFYDWMMEEGLRPDNPARQTPKIRKRKPARYRLTLEETQRFLFAASGRRERWLTRLGVCSGLRLQELNGLQGRHFTRTGWIWVSEDIGKGSKERWEPVLPPLAPVVAEIQELCELDDYVFCAQRWRNPGINTAKLDLSKFPCDSKVLWRMARRVGERAGIPAPVTPHMMRHAFGEHIARRTGDMKIAQALLGHADLSSTQIYLGEPTLDDLAQAVAGLQLGFDDPLLGDMSAVAPTEPPANPLVGATGIEPVLSFSRLLERILETPEGRALVERALRRFQRNPNDDTDSNRRNSQ